MPHAIFGKVVDIFHNPFPHSLQGQIDFGARRESISFRRETEDDIPGRFAVIAAET